MQVQARCRRPLIAARPVRNAKSTPLKEITTALHRRSGSARPRHRHFILTMPQLAVRTRQLIQAGAHRTIVSCSVRGRGCIAATKGSGAIASFITASSAAHLNSVVTTAAGVILDSWQNANAYRVGQVIFDATNTQQVSACNGTCTSGGSPPTWPTVVGNTVLDGTAPNQVTWKMLYAGRVGNETRATTLLISDCTINGNNNAAITNELRISGLGGGMA